MKPILGPISLAHRKGLSSLASLTVCSLTLLLPSAATAIPIIVNGSFESPDVPSHSAFNSATPTGWSTSPGAFVFVQDSSGGGLGALNLPSAQDGDQYVGMTANPGWTLYQDFTIAAGNYTLSWYNNATIGFTTHYLLGLRGSPTSPMNPMDFTVTGASSWTAHSLNFNLAAGTYRLEFLTSPSAGAAPFWDNVSLDLATSTSVPETGSTIGLLSLALGGIAFLSEETRSIGLTGFADSVGNRR